MAAPMSSHVPVGIPRDKRAQTVRAWKGLRGEAKLAWQFLYYVCERVGGTPRGQPGTVSVSFGAIGDDQGTTEKAGSRSFESLVRTGLIEVIDTRSVHKVCFLPDPLDVARARRAHAGDGQGELIDVHEEPEQPADELKCAAVVFRPRPPATEPPAEASGGRPSTAAEWPPPRRPDVGRFGGSAGASAGGSGADPSADTSVTSETSEEVVSKETSNFGTTSEAQPFRVKSSEGAKLRSADPPPDPPDGSVGGVIDRLLAGLIPSPAKQAAWIEELVLWIQGRVHDPKLRDTPCLRVAHAIVEGYYPAVHLVNVMRSLDRADERGTLRLERWSYFVTTVRKSMATHDTRNR